MGFRAGLMRDAGGGFASRVFGSGLALVLLCCPFASWMGAMDSGWLWKSGEETGNGMAGGCLIWSGMVGSISVRCGAMVRFQSGRRTTRRDHINGGCSSNTNAGIFSNPSFDTFCCCFGRLGAPLSAKVEGTESRWEAR
ncbi:hypothetical protein B0T14DRAFT_84648 [Immersiella caudata]|uniref:Uncharacterized protein n=1 Tax=Immersiella caudata TaxID=314043 RepID=A0AA39XIJ7_9PEZI|nr:hypothetical protein B0T14DRAFT_84648 [Immersiella caudata]